MSEWWSYRLSDFLMFSARTYYRLFELYNRDVWPLHLLTIAAGIAMLVLLIRRRDDGRLLSVMLAAVWLWVAWAFHLQRYQTILWAARWFAALFVLQALLTLALGFVRKGLAPRGFPSFASVCLAFTLFVQPLIAILCGRPWMQMEVFGIAPDPTAAATLAVLIARRRIALAIIPLLWAAFSGATLFTMDARDWLVLPAFALIAFIAMLLRPRHDDEHAPRVLA